MTRDWCNSGDRKLCDDFLNCFSDLFGVRFGFVAHHRLSGAAKHEFLIRVIDEIQDKRPLSVAVEGAVRVGRAIPHAIMASVIWPDAWPITPACILVDRIFLLASYVRNDSQVGTVGQFNFAEALRGKALVQCAPQRCIRAWGKRWRVWRRFNRIGAIFFEVYSVIMVRRDTHSRA